MARVGRVRAVIVVVVALLTAGCTDGARSRPGSAPTHVPHRSARAVTAADFCDARAVVGTVRFGHLWFHPGHVVNLLDLNAIATDFGTSNQMSASGDFTYDGIVNLADFNALAGQFGNSTSVVDPIPASTVAGSLFSERSVTNGDQNLLGVIG